MGNCFSRDIDGFDRRTGKHVNDGYYEYAMPDASLGMGGGRYRGGMGMGGGYGNYDDRTMHYLGRRRRRHNRRTAIAGLAASAVAC
ncbi:hypothetical protein SBRCBS47491_007625 [Sporothrix bragantina]|uniref:Uncharacterized protein n=1 Tax=Sporothrix bragantina TaxID=671064 RepID=A0ABP0CES4_9PEZI